MTSALPSFRGRRALVTLLAAFCAATGWLAWKALGDPDTPFLSPRSGVSWILYPTPPSAQPQPAFELDATFRRSFVLERTPESAALSVRWFRRGAVFLNGTLVAASAPERSWKTPVTTDVARLLRAGENLIEARTGNDAGPPAFWLSLIGAGLRIETDGSWDAVLAGASARKARRAEVPMSDWSSRGGSPAASPSPLAAARANLPLLLLFAALSLAGVALVRAWERRAGGEARLARLGHRGALILFLAVAAAWSLLFWRARLLSSEWGFDSESHLDYVRSILVEHHLPLADEGWETYQPPLYYLLAAGLLRLAGHTAVDASALPLLHGLGLLAGLLQCGAVLAGLRLLFEDRVRPVLAGLCLAAFLPVHFYMFQYVSNEGLHAALSTLALVLAIGILKREDTSPRAHLFLGAALGLAMLAKFSALITLVLIAAVLAGRLAASRSREPRVWLRTLGGLALGLLLVCGWHYARVTAHFGRPIVGNWDADLGFSWWMDPGYATAGQLVRFGRSLTAPLFSAYHSLPDAIYSTFWGDGLLGGASATTLRPPWNIGLMNAGYLLALLPSLALLAGLAWALVRLVRDPRAEWILLLGVLGATAFAVLAMGLKLPFYAQPKAFYGLAAMLSIAALTARGCEILARGRFAGLLVYVLLGTWGLCSYFTFWVARGSTGQLSTAALSTLDPEGLLSRSAAAAAQGRDEEAVEMARRATALAPDHPTAWAQLGILLARTGHPDEAIAALREELRVTPRDREIHARLAALYRQQGSSLPAQYHQRYAERLPHWGI